jgi:hypothetical protein
VTSNQIGQRRSDLAAAKQKAAVATAQVGALQPYVKFAALEQARLQTVHDLAASRFDWERAMGGLARVTTHDVWLTSMLGTVAPGVAVEDAGSSDSDPRDAQAVPAAELSGCATSNGAVVGYLSRLRALAGVTHVTLADSEKPDGPGPASGSTSSSSSGGAASEDCGPDPDVPAFQIVVFFHAPPAPAAAPTTTPPAGGTG